MGNKQSNECSNQDWGCGGIYRRTEGPATVQPVAIDAPQVDNTWALCASNDNANTWACPPDT